MGNLICGNCICADPIYITIIETFKYKKGVWCSDYPDYHINLPKKNGEAALNIFNEKNPCPYYIKLKDISKFTECGNILCVVKPVKNSKIFKEVKYGIYNYTTDKLNITHVMDICDEDTVQFLIDNGLHINEALFFACSRGYLHIVKYLVQRGANINATDNCKTSALNFAAKNGHLEIVKYLVECGVYIHDRSCFLAITYNHHEIVKYLEEKGAGVSYFYAF